MSTVTSRGAQQTGARGLISGTVSTGATWYEDISITEDDTVVTNADTWTWTLKFRENETDSSAVLTLSTTAGTLIISQTASATLLQIRVPQASLTALDGDYFADLKSVDPSSTTYDSAGRSIHWAHGSVTFLNEPI